MVLCWIALPIFAILGIFSVKYRKLAFDSLDCIFKTVTLRKCTTGLDKKIKAHISGSIFRYSPFLGKIVRKHFAIFSWIFVILMIWSTYVSGVGVYNYALYGNCNGPESTDFCIFDPAGEHTGCSEVDYTPPEVIIAPSIDNNDPVFGNPDADLQIIYFGCYTCENTKKVEPIVKELLELYGDKIGIHFKNFAIPTHTFAYETSLAAECVFAQDKYFEYHEGLFLLDTYSNETLYALAEDVGVNITQFDTCYSNQTYFTAVDEDIQQGVNAGIPGTPTFYIGNQQIVGTKPLKTFTTIIDQELGQ